MAGRRTVFVTSSFSMMSDLHSLGNLVYLLLTMGSLMVWGRMAQRRSSGDDPLPLRPREACPWAGLSVALVIPVAYLISGFVLGAVGAGSEFHPARVPANCLALVLQAFTAIGLLAVGGPLRPADFGIDREHFSADVRSGTLWFLASWAPVLAVNLLVQAFGLRGDDQKHQLLKLLEETPGSSTILWIAISVTIAAPLVEELVYRVILQGWLETRMPVPLGIGFVALIFSAVHAMPDCIPIFPLALILGWVYHRLHSYTAVVVLHVLFNAANLGLALLMRR